MQTPSPMLPVLLLALAACVRGACVPDAPSKDGGCGCVDLEPCKKAEPVLDNMFTYGGYECGNTLLQIVDGLPAGSEDFKAELMKTDPNIQSSQVSDWCPKYCGTCTAPATATLSFPDLKWWTRGTEAAFKAGMITEYCGYMGLKDPCMTIDSLTAKPAQVAGAGGRRLAADPATIVVTVVNTDEQPPMSSLTALEVMIGKQHPADGSAPLEATPMATGDVGAAKQGIVITKNIPEPGSLTGLIAGAVVLILLVFFVCPGVCICYCCKCCCFKKKDTVSQTPP